jgi:hypothetical protein
VYLRHSVQRKNGKAQTYWRLVRSVRRDGKVVQETVAPSAAIRGTNVVPTPAAKSAKKQESEL